MKKILMILLFLFTIGSLSAQTFSVQLKITVVNDSIPELKDFKEVKGILDFTADVIELIIYNKESGDYDFKSYDIIKSKLLEGKGIRVYYLKNRMTGNFLKLFSMNGVDDEMMMMLSEGGRDTYLVMVPLI